MSELKSNIFDDIKKGDRDPLDFYLDKTISLLRKHDNDTVKKRVNILNLDLVKKDRKLAIALTFGIVNKQKKLQVKLKKDIKKSLRPRSIKFNSKKFFRTLNNLCEDFLMSHEDEKKFVNDLDEVYDKCKKLKK
jgi:hypothetical protein